MKSLLSRDISSIDAVIPRPKPGNIKRVSPTARIIGTGHSPNDSVGCQRCSQRLWLEPSIKDLGPVRWVRQDDDKWNGSKSFVNCYKPWWSVRLQSRKSLGGLHQVSGLDNERCRTNIYKLCMRLFFQKQNTLHGCCIVNTPHLTIGLSVLAAASLFLRDPLVIPGTSTGGASSRGWIAPANFSRYATNSG